MTDTQANDVQHPGWGRLALSVIVAATTVRVMVVFASPIPLFFDEAQYWIWAQDLAFGYFSKPPVIAWAIAGTTSVCGDGSGCVRLSAPLFHGATALVLYFLGRHFYDSRAGFWTSVSYVVLPGVSLSAVVVSTDAYLLFFWAVALLAFVRAEATNQTIWWIIFGLSLGLGLLSKYAMVFFIIGLVIDATWRKSGPAAWRRTGFALGLGIAFFVYLPNLWWNWSNGWPSYLHTGDNINLGSDLFNPVQALEFIGAQFGVFGPFLFAAFLWLCFKLIATNAGRPSLSDKQRRLLSFSLPVLALIVVQALLSRSHANWAATAYISATVFVIGELLLLKKSVWLKASLVLHASAALLFYNFDIIVRSFDLPITPGLDPARRMRGWDRAGDWVSTVRQDFPDVRLLFDDRKVLSEVLYYSSPHPFDAAMWNPKGQRNNHFEMTAPLQDSRGEDFLYVIKHDWPDRAATFFAESRLIGTFRSRAFTGDVLEVRAYLLSDFQGYEK